MTPPTTIEFWVPGRPITQGSKNNYGKKKMVDSSPKLKNWRTSVRDASRDTLKEFLRERKVQMSWLDEQPWKNPFWSDPIRADLVFLFPRSMGHYGTGRNEGILKPSAPILPGHKSAGDIDKLQRAVFDSLTGVIYSDDSHVTDVYAVKRYCSYGSVGGVQVKLTVLGEEDV